MVTLATGFPSLVRMSCSDVNLSLLPVTAEIYGSTLCLWVWPWNLFAVVSSIHIPTQTWNVSAPGVALASVQFSSVAQLCPTLCDPKNCTPGLLSITNSRSPPKPMSIESVMPSNYLIFCRPLLLLPSIFPSIRVFSNESVLRIRWPKYWRFNFNISPSDEHPGLISFRMDWLDLLAVQESSPTPQFKSINSSALSFLYIPTLTSIHDYWKNLSLD